jgi:chromosome segregation ATPase
VSECTVCTDILKERHERELLDRLKQLAAAQAERDSHIRSENSLIKELDAAGDLSNEIALECRRLSAKIGVLTYEKDELRALYADACAQVASLTAARDLYAAMLLEV